MAIKSTFFVTTIIVSTEMTRKTTTIAAQLTNSSLEAPEDPLVALSTPSPLSLDNFSLKQSPWPQGSQIFTCAAQLTAIYVISVNVQEFNELTALKDLITEEVATKQQVIAASEAAAEDLPSA